MKISWAWNWRLWIVGLEVWRDPRLLAVYVGPLSCAVYGGKQQEKKGAQA